MRGWLAVRPSVRPEWGPKGVPKRRTLPPLSPSCEVDGLEDSLIFFCQAYPVFFVMIDSKGILESIGSEGLFRTSGNSKSLFFIKSLSKPSQTLPKCPWRPLRSCAMRWCRTVFMTPSYEGLKSLFRTSGNSKSLFLRFLALVEVFDDFSPENRIQHVELL